MDMETEMVGGTRRVGTYLMCWAELGYVGV